MPSPSWRSRHCRPTFPYFPYVNPNAPKGGEVTLASIGTFDSFNPFILRGTSTLGMVSPWVILPGGSGSGSTVGHVWESLLTSSADEAAPATAIWPRRSNCRPTRCGSPSSCGRRRSSPTARRSPPRMSPGPIDTLLEKGRPGFRIQMADVKDVEVEGPRRVVFHFKSNENRELPLILGGLPVLPKHFFEGRDFTKPLTDPPIGSGPYRIASFELGRSVTYERRPDWWAANLPTGKGTNNFDRVRIEYFRDSTVAMEAFKAGQIDLRSENISKNWATAYDFPAVARGLVIKREFRHHLPTGMQGYAMNTRRPVFANPLVRQAMAEVFDFEWANKNLFYGGYTRTYSYFSNSHLASSGIPAGRRAETAGAVSQGAAAGAVHRAVQAAGDRWLRQQPRAVAPRAGAAGAGGLDGEGAQAGRQERRSR